MRIYITFGGRAYDETTERIVQDAPRFGVDEVRVYDDRWLMESGKGFYCRHSWLWHTGGNADFDHKNFGFGWCAWKPYIWRHAMMNSRPGDLLLYTDADTYPISDLSPIFDICERERAVVFQVQGCLHRRFTRRQCFVQMGVQNPEQYADTVMQGCGRFQMFANQGHASEECDQFLGQWEDFSTSYECQRLRGPGREFEGYHRHSNEPSILSILAIKHGLKGHREACQAGWPASQPEQGKPGDDYPQLFVQEYCKGNRADLSGSRFRNV